MDNKIKDPIHVEQKHSENCYTKNQPSPSFIISKTWWRAKDGTERGYTTKWIEFKCKNNKCRAKVFIREDVLLRFVEKCYREENSLTK